jgi:hypothetical protein
MKNTTSTVMAQRSRYSIRASIAESKLAYELNAAQLLVFERMSSR